VSDWTVGLIRAVDLTGGVDAIFEHRSLPMCFDLLPELRPNRGLVLTSDSALLRS
jgi:hypothetical protein